MSDPQGRAPGTVESTAPPALWPPADPVVRDPDGAPAPTGIPTDPDLTTDRELPPDRDEQAAWLPDLPAGVDEPRDWAWVEEWRAGREQVPWTPGVALTIFVGLIVASAVYVLSAGLADRPLIAILVNLFVAGGITPAVWLARGIPVLRWVALGAVLGVLAAWVAVFIFLI